MLRIIQQTSADAAKSYYSKADYLSEGQEIIGKWGGRGSAMLGLTGQVDKQNFDMLCDNKDPRTGDRLTLRNKANRTVGYDFNFHVPKGVSLAYMLNHDERIFDVFVQSMDETMKEIETDAATRIRKHDQMEERQTSNLAWGSFIHTTTRPIGGEPDMHLHGHCFVFNMTWDRVEEAWKAVQFRELKRDAPYYEAAFHARMAKGMKELGYAIERNENGWDIAGIERSTIEKFSRRTLEIEKIAKELGIEDDSAKDQLGAKTRSKKDSTKPLSDLEPSWRSRLTRQEMNALNMLLYSDAWEPTDPCRREIEAMEYAKLHCFERDSVVPERKLLTEALKFGVGDVTVAGVNHAMQSQGVINRNLHGRKWVTTPEVLAEESQMLQMARNGLKSAPALNPHWDLKREWLNDDQKKAVDHVLNSTDKVMILRGGAGTGKTTLMREAIEGIEEGERKVFTFAPSADASRGVLAAEGFKATTVAELLLSKNLQQDVRDNVIWIDEAGLLGTRDLKQVMDIADSQNARLILSGDWKQHGSVARGAALRLLEQEGGIEPVLIKNIQRQQGEYKEAVANLSEGLTHEGFDLLDKLGWVHELGDPEERYVTMAKSFANGMEAGETVLAIAPTHAEAEILTSNIRGELKARKIVDEKEQSFELLKPMYLTEGQRQDAYQVAQGDVMVFHRSGKDMKKGDRLEANEANASRFRKHAKQFEVYRRMELKLAKGDLIRITKNGKTKDLQHNLNNGQVFKIREFNKRGDIVLNNGWTLAKDYGFIAPGYVSTSHSAQGKTVDRVLIAESAMSYAAADQAQFYVSVSRGRSRAEIFTDDNDGLIEAISKQGPRVSATELVTKPTIEKIHRMQRQQVQQMQQVKEREPERVPAYERV